MKVGASDARDLPGWNQFELVACGTVVSLTVNGYLVWSRTDPAPRSGPIALTGDRGGFAVRNIRVRSLNPVTAP
ncbi:MAG: family 16 glycoside hydrolase [Lacunisphaera sp.]